MENRKLVDFVRQYPQIWDRNHPYFRDKDIKEKAWDEVAANMNIAVDICKDTFKSMREKYVREREKVQHHGDFYKEWDMLNDLKFLDPHIIPRATAWNGAGVVEDDVSVNSDNDPTEFDRRLIDSVRKASAIWDRNSNTYPNKTSKNQLWEDIASGLNRDVNACMLRWKALREKYIRQKIKFQEGEAKWELLDNLSFLDKVIQYRRKQSDCSRLGYGGGVETNKYAYFPKDNSNSNSFRKSESSRARCNFELDDNSYTDSSNDFLLIVKEENVTVQQVADSSFNSDVKRQRSASINSEVLPEKRLKGEDVPQTPEIPENTSSGKNEKTPEQLFGDLVASLLSKKPENQRNLYMIEIMTVLSK